MVKIRRRADDLLLDLRGGNGSVTIEDWFASDAARIETVQFDGDIAWDLSKLAIPDLSKKAAKGRLDPSHGQGDAPEDAHPHRHTAEQDNERTVQPGRTSSDRTATADLLDALLGAGTGSEFETSAQAIPASERDVSARGHAAKQWRRVSSYLERLLEADHDGREGAGAVSHGEWNGMDARADGSSFGHAGSTGLTRGLANMKTLRGLEEGFQRLHI
jgi:hypothetical protein